MTPASGSGGRRAGPANGGWTWTVRDGHVPGYVMSELVGRRALRDELRAVGLRAVRVEAAIGRFRDSWRGPAWSRGCRRAPGTWWS